MPNPPSHMGGDSSILPVLTKKREVVLFSSTAIALYGYDQGKLDGTSSHSPLFLIELYRDDVSDQYKSLLPQNHANI